MRQIIYRDNGDPEAMVEVVDAPAPEAEPGQVLVALEAAPIHIADLKAIRGEIRFIAPGGGVPGFEGAGRICAVGAGVDGWAVGDRVILPVGFGAWREIVVADPAQLWRAPDGVAAEQLALVRVNLTTAYALLKAFVDLQPGDWVVQNAANSNVGGYVAQLAEGFGVNLIDVVRRPALVERLIGEGRRHVLTDGPSLSDQIRAIATRPPRIAFDAVGGEATARLGACVEDHALVVCYGYLSEEAYRIEYEDLMYRGVTPVGFLTNWAVARLSDAQQQGMRDAFDAMMQTGALNAQIAAVYPFAEIKAAIRHAAQTGEDRRGKIILTPDG